MLNSLFQFATGTNVNSHSGLTSDKASGLGGNIKTILEGIIGIMAIFCVIFVIVGGVQYLSSAGDASKVEKGKKTIIYAIVGLIICALAFAIVQFVIGSVLSQ